MNEIVGFEEFLNPSTILELFTSSFLETLPLYTNHLIVGIHNTNDEIPSNRTSTQPSGWVNMVTDPVIQADQITYQRE